MSSPFDLTGRRALVTGSSRGIGLAIARSLLGAGAQVVIHGRNAEAAETTAAALASEFGAGAVSSAGFDVTDEASVLEGVAGVEAVGPVDILVNNAGLQHREPMLEVSVQDWERVIRTDLTSAFLVGRTVARGMIGRGAGAIVNICSVQTDLARPTIGAYTAAKHGLRGLTRAMTAEWSGSGVRVNGVAPGYIRTELTQALVDDPAFNAWVLGRTPIGRWGEPEDIGGAVVWLSSDASRFVTGQVVFVDGGMTAVV
ncbi:glucose 1-dehydrogenase [Microbacterium azadirachtae]|uniref:Gluconate 5-dehydrogenase n=1 Tax=Microbacterium azadirachtae TaxID=582680 RepID=A0A0F0LBX6_9MICO|nr:glucose 1-dehydrogenase [Microbacterium azadirachtae]KJL30687.1 Gluconate 5-dehydrogenase [Microbacterium azadirachtae]